MLTLSLDLALLPHIMLCCCAVVPRANNDDLLCLIVTNPSSHLSFYAVSIERTVHPAQFYSRRFPLIGLIQCRTYEEPFALFV